MSIAEELADIRNLIERSGSLNSCCRCCELAEAVDRLTAIMEADLEREAAEAAAAVGAYYTPAELIEPAVGSGAFLGDIAGNPPPEPPADTPHYAGGEA